ncbi:pyrroline-5-carboxylate reductase family protein [Aminobacter sp. Piv2-1]|uniref:pyrroline-5-carboxylate reductase family protein n=1 Tax=Aminobacter sp. Piv2-1 TaxID=3031122 RepID=UPI0030B05D6E
MPHGAIDKTYGNALSPLDGYDISLFERQSEISRATRIRRWLHKHAPEVTDTLVRQMLLGSAKLLASTTKSAAILKATVTTPKGTTEAGLSVLQHENTLAQLLSRAVRDAHQRARELGLGGLVARSLGCSNGRHPAVTPCSIKAGSLLIKQIMGN